MQDHHLLGEDHIGERLEILLRVIGQVGEQKRIERDGACGQKAEGMPVRLGVLARGGSDRRASAGLVVDDESVARSFLESFTQCAGKHIDRPPGGEGNDQSHRLRGKILGAGGDPREQQRASGREQPCAGFDEHRLLPYSGGPSFEASRAYMRLWIARAQIGGDRNHVLHRQLLDNRPHQRGRDAGARTGFHVVELAHDISGRAARDRRHLAETLQRLAMTDQARDGLAAIAGRHQRFTPRDAARRHMIDEAGMRVAALRARLFLRQHDDAVADRLSFIAGRDETHAARADIGLWHRLGLDHLGPDAGLERSEILAGGERVGIRDRLRDRDHRGCSHALALAVLEGGQLAQKIGHRKTREARGFRMTVPARQVA